MLSSLLMLFIFYIYGLRIPTASSSQQHNPSPPPLQDDTNTDEHQPPPVPPVRIAVMGATGSGKTSFINLARGSNLPLAMGPESRTAEVQAADEFTLDGRAVTLIDTPGFDDTITNDTDILRAVALFLDATYEDGSTLAGVIYIHRISDNRFGGIARRNFNMFRKLCGGSTLKNIVLATSIWGEGSQDINEAHEKELSGKYFKPALEKGARMVRHYNTIQSAHDIVRGIMKDHPTVLPIHPELVEEREDIIDVTAGRFISQELKEQIRRHHAELKDLREEMRRALKEKDSEGLVQGTKEKEMAGAEHQLQLTDLTRRLQDETNVSMAHRERFEQEIQKLRDRVATAITTPPLPTPSQGQEREVSPDGQEIGKLRERMEEIEKNSKRATSIYTAEGERLEARIMKMEEEAKKERERVEAEHNRRLADLNHRLQDTVNASAVEQLRLEQEVRERQQMEVRLADLNRRLRDVTNASVSDQGRLEQEMKEREQAVADHQQQLTNLTREIDTSMARLEQDARERQRVEAEHSRQLTDLERHLHDATNAFEADQAKWERIGQDQATRQKLEERTRELRGQMKEVKRVSEGLEARVKEMEQERELAEAELASLNHRLQDATNLSATDRARLQREVKEMRLAEVEHKKQLADLARRLQDEAEVSAAHRTRLEREIERLQDRVAITVTMPLRSSPRPALSPLPRDQASAGEHQSTIRIAVMGATGSGKTSFINLASGSNLRVGTGLESCTAEVQLAGKFTLDGRVVTLIDTPGFDDTSKSDTEILKIIAAFLAATYEKGSKLTGVIYVHRISDNRFGGISRRNFNLFRKLCGESTLKNVVLVTNMWGVDPQDVNEARESELSTKFFKPALDLDARMARHHNTVQSAHDIIRTIMDNHPVVLQIQRELVDEGKDIGDTAAGETVNQELKDQISQHQAKLKELREEMTEALKTKDEEMRQKLEEVNSDLQKKMEKAEKDLETMAANYAAEKERMEAKMNEMEREAKQERERTEAKYDQKLAALADHIPPNVSAVDRTRQDIRRSEDRVTIPVYSAFNGRDQIGSTREYPSAGRVSRVRKALLQDARPRGIFKRHAYVEVVMRGQTEGKFLEDPEAYYDESIGQVSKLVHWTHADIDREVEGINLTSHGISKVMIGTISSLVGHTTYYRHVLLARSARDALRNRPNGGTQR